MAGQTNAFDQQLPNILELWSRNLRNGNSNIRAFKDIAQHTGHPAAGQISRVVDDVASGVPLEAALQNLLKRVPSDHLAQVLDVVDQHRQRGGDLPEMLDKVRRQLEKVEK
ncbi:MAG: type II secretion system F family protein, partial [bacterium]|nr:type II secretion system F family protein [bacterium]